MLFSRLFISYALLHILFYTFPASAGSLLSSGRSTAIETIDCNEKTAWNSGGYAPASVFIEIRNNSKPISIIKLIPAQSPSGKTTHEILVSDSGNNYRSVDEILEEYTEDGVPIIRTFDPPLLNVEKIKVITKTSPSWVAWYEIQAYSSAKEMNRGCK